MNTAEIGPHPNTDENVERIFSVAQPGFLLHCIANSVKQSSNRIDVSPEKEFLQASIIPLKAGKSVSPHIHVPRASAAGPTITQECWVVMRGAIRVRLFDLDKALLAEHTLLPGCFLASFGGGHSLECLEDDTVLLEFKNGPYLGPDYQKFDA